MTIEARKIAIVQRLFNVEQKTILDKIEQLLIGNNLVNETQAGYHIKTNSNNVESKKIELVKNLLITEESILFQIESIIDNEEIVAYTTQQEPLTKMAYIKEIKAAEQEIENGAFVTHEQLLENIKKW